MSDGHAHLPPELREADEGDEATDSTPRKRRTKLIVWLIALVVAVAMAGYGLLPLFQGGNGEQGYPQEAPAPPATPTGSIEAFGEQQPDWVDCADGMQCAQVWAPLDWNEPAGERITLALIKQPATGGERLGTLFVNPGGPGASGVEFLVRGAGAAVSADVQAQYDVIAWDPRGVNLSTPVTCLDAAGLDEVLFGDGELSDLEVGSDEWIAQARTESAEFGAACAASTGPLIEHVGTDSTIQDLDMLRQIVGDDALNFFGYSYGTYIGAQYAERYPDRVGRLVLDGAMDPQTTLSEVVREQTRSFEDALRRYVDDCVLRENCPGIAMNGLSGTGPGLADAVMEWIGSLLDRADTETMRASDGRVLNSGTLLTAIITPLYSADSAEMLDDLFMSVAQGDPETAFWYADYYYDRVDGEYASNSTESFQAINCLDYPSDDDPERMRERAAELAEIAPTIGRFQGYGDISCAEWPASATAERTAVSAAGADPILVVGTTGDTATPYRWAESLAKQLESGQLLTYVGEGHTAYGGNTCIDTAVDEYLLTGALPAEGTRCEA